MHKTISQYPWKFVRVGGFDQVRLDSGADIAALPELDKTLWAALSCPAQGLEFDTRTLALIDSDQDGRIRVPEILQAVHWAVAQLRNPDDLLKEAPELPLAAINSATLEGQQLLTTARRVLAMLGKGDASSISVLDATDTTRLFAQTPFNGDGIITLEATSDTTLQTIIHDIMTTLGSVMDRNQQCGVGTEQITAFFTQAQAYDIWWRTAEENATELLPLGEETAPAYALLCQVRARIDDYFTRCRLAAYDERAARALNRTLEEFQALSPQTLSATGVEFADFPLAHIAAGRDLPLDVGCNPAWHATLNQLRTRVIEPLLGGIHATLSDEQWQTIKARFDPHAAWLNSQAGSAVAPLGIARVREILRSGAQEELNALIAQDLALEPEISAITAVERLARYHRDLYRLLNNFVSFRDFYDPQCAWAIFEAGTLYLDSRACHLTIRVADITQHAVLAAWSKTYLVYCECIRQATGERMTIAAAITGGDADQLMVGRNGVFYDRQGRDWDATIVKLIENPISIRQAIWAPYKRIARLIGEQTARLAAARDKVVDSSATAGIQAALTHPDPPKPPPFDAAKFAGIFAAIGLALGALGTALASLVTGFFGLSWWQMPLALGSIMALISVPSVVIALLKLRRRNLGPILDASGWAVNARLKINIPFGGSLTETAVLPPNAKRSLTDPFQEKSYTVWLWGTILCVALGWMLYYFLTQILPQLT